MQHRRWVRVAVLAVVLAAVFLALRRALGVGFGPESVRDVVEDMGIWAPLVFIGIVAFRIPLLVPSALVLIGGGLIFGSVDGTLYGAIGLLLTALAMFTSARWTGGEAAVARLPARYAGLVDVARSRLAAVLVALGTGYPLTPSISALHLLAGMTGMALPLFALAAALGSLVRAALFTYFGSSLIEGDIDRVLQACGLFAAVALLPLAFPASRAWLLQGMGRRAGS